MPVYLPCFHTLNVLEKKKSNWKTFFFAVGLSQQDNRAWVGLTWPLALLAVASCHLTVLGASGSTSRTRNTALPLCGNSNLQKPVWSWNRFFVSLFALFFFLYITLNAQNITNPHSSCIASSSSSSLPSCSGRPPGGAEEPRGEALTKVGAQHQPSVVVIFFFCYY